MRETANDHHQPPECNTYSGHNFYNKIPFSFSYKIANLIRPVVKMLLPEWFPSGVGFV